jgi:lipopolysaccharide export system protein LptA
VNANFTSAMGAKRQQGVVRVHSQTLVYSDKTRQGDFHGTVVAEQSDEVVRADDALLFLKPATPAAKSGLNPPKPAGNAGNNPVAAPGVSKQNSQLDHMVATGHVVFTQPGRKGSGEKLVYTADDGKYMLTGSDSVLPQMWDRVHGTTTGAALIFNSQDDSVEVSGGKSSALTDTRAKK